MKKFLKYLPIGSAFFVLLTFILMMASKALVNANSSSLDIEGTTAIFGKTTTSALGTATTHAGVADTFAWVFVLLSLLCLLALCVLQFVKLDLLKKFGKFALVGICALMVVAGILLFCTKAAVGGANGWTVADMNDLGYKLTGGYVIAGISAILAGLLAGCPACLELLGKAE